MNIYTISDTHFGHVKLQQGGIRPYDNDEKLWKGFDSLPDDSILIHCGDLTIGHDAITHLKLSKYKFKKWLVLGNHDNHSISWYITNGWDFVAHEVLIKMFGRHILFTHMPVPKREGVDMNIHGHLHDGKSRGFPDFYDEKYHKEVTPEVIGYVPAKLGNQVI
jgi:calcineurin-like phosphoesterase family protein